MDLTTLASVKQYLESQQVQAVNDEAGAIPGTSPYTITVAQAATWIADLGVNFTVGGASLTRIATGTPATGQYLVASGVYTFAVADKSKAVQISYQYTSEAEWNAPWDAIIEDLISAVSAEAEAYCNRAFEKVERTEYHDGGGRFLFLRSIPVTEIDSIKGSDYWDWVNADEVSGDSYGLQASSGMVQYRGGEWPYDKGAIQVTYTGGYDPYSANPGAGYVPIPADLENAACREAAYRFRRRKDLGLQSVSFPDGSIQKMDTGQFLKEVKTILDRYRLRRVG